MALSAVSGAGSYVSGENTDGASQLSKLEEEERELQQKLSSLQKKSSEADTTALQRQQVLVQRQLTQVQQQIRQVESRQGSQTSVNRLTGSDYEQKNSVEKGIFDTFA